MDIDTDRSLKEIRSGFETPNVVNADNEGLHPWGPTGHVDEVNGPGAAEVPGFAPTRHELMWLAKYWIDEIIEIRWFHFCHQQSGSTEIRLESFAERRLNRIAAAIGDAEVKTIVDGAWKEFGEGQACGLWDIFLNGDPTQRNQVAEEMNRLVSEAS